MPQFQRHLLCSHGFPDPEKGVQVPVVVVARADVGKGVTRSEPLVVTMVVVLMALMTQLMMVVTQMVVVAVLTGVQLMGTSYRTQRRNRGSTVASSMEVTVTHRSRQWSTLMMMMMMMMLMVVVMGVTPMVVAVLTGSQLMGMLYQTQRSNQRSTVALSMEVTMSPTMMRMMMRMVMVRMMLMMAVVMGVTPMVATVLAGVQLTWMLYQTQRSNQWSAVALSMEGTMPPTMMRKMMMMRMVMVRMMLTVVMEVTRVVVEMLTAVQLVAPYRTQRRNRGSTLAFSIEVTVTHRSGVWSTVMTMMMMMLMMMTMSVPHVVDAGAGSWKWMSRQMVEGHWT
jgi:hypothetical protein